MNASMPQSKPPIDQIQAYIESNESPWDYFNGFNLAIGTGDVNIILMRNNQPVRTLQVSYPVAKSLAHALTSALLALEELTGNEIMTTHYIEEKFKAVNNGTP